MAVSYVFNPFTGNLDAVNPAGSTSSFFFTQGTAASTWLINHNLNSPVSVTLYDASGNEIDSDVVASSLNLITVTFANPQTGSAVIIA